jgi:hypothetical protein
VSPSSADEMLILNKTKFSLQLYTIFSESVDIHDDVKISVSVVFFCHCRHSFCRHSSLKNIVTDLINALPGNSSLNKVQHATIEEAVFSVSAVTTRSGGWWSCDMCFLWLVSVPRLHKWQNSFSSGTSQFSVGDSHGMFVIEEEYKKSACEDLTCN